MDSALGTMLVVGMMGAVACGDSGGSGGGSSSGSDKTSSGSAPLTLDQSDACKKYVECTSAVAPSGLGPVLDAYGPDGSCWGENEDLWNTCNDACINGTSDWAASFPDEQACWGCVENADCDEPTPVCDQAQHVCGGSATNRCVADVTGDWLFTLSLRLDPKKAFVFVSNLSAGNGPSLVDMTLQPLSAQDQMTPAACPPLTFTDLLVNADGTFSWELAVDSAPLTLCGESNPISGSDIVTGLAISGALCAGAQAGFVCGDASGIVVSPIPSFDWSGSTFTLQRIMGALPPPVIDCDGTPAEY